MDLEAVDGRHGEDPPHPEPQLLRGKAGQDAREGREVALADRVLARAGRAADRTAPRTAAADLMTVSVTMTCPADHARSQMTGLRRSRSGGRRSRACRSERLLLWRAGASRSPGRLHASIRGRRDSAVATSHSSGLRRHVAEGSDWCPGTEYGK